MYGIQLLGPTRPEKKMLCVSRVPLLSCVAPPERMST